MPQFISTNVTSIIARNNLDASSNSLSTSIERLSSGQRINSSKDDAAGMAIASRMTSQIMGMQMAKRNTQDAISMTQTSEGALGTQVEQLQRIRELAVQAANGILGVGDRAKLDNEAQSLLDEIDRIATTTSFNGNLLLSDRDKITSQVDTPVASFFDEPTFTQMDGNGLVITSTATGITPAWISQGTNDTDITVDLGLIDSDDIGTKFTVTATALSGVLPASVSREYQVQSTGDRDAAGNNVFEVVDITDANTVNFQVGADHGQNRNVTFKSTTSVDLGLIDSAEAMVRISLASTDDAGSTIARIDDALKYINDERSNMGAYQNRLGQTISNLNASIENTSASRSRIEDTDFAQETANMTKNQILHQAGIAMLQQANSLPESVLSLLK